MKLYLLSSLGLVLTLAGCSSGSSSDTNQGLPTAYQVREALDGAWTGSIRDTQDNLTLEMAYAAPGASPLCGTRTVSHSLCMDITQSHLSAKVTSSDARLTGLEGAGTLQIFGNWNDQTGRYGQVDVPLGSGPAWRLSANLKDTKLEGTLVPGSGVSTTSLAFSLERVE